MERTRVLLPDQAILPSWAPRCRTATVSVALLRPDPVRGRSLAEDRVEMDRKGLETALANTVL